VTLFDDGKDDGALRTIGELGQALGLKPHVLRYWEEQFPTLQPLKRSGGRRYYRPEDVALVETIDRLVNREGYTLKGARQAIEDGHAARGSTVQAVATASEARQASDFSGGLPPTSAALEIVEELKDIRARLAAAVGA
jgi:DNA-binding transcriptional MerR regulator